MESGTHIRLVLVRAAKAIENVDRTSIAGTGLVFGDFTILEALLHKGPLPINTIGEKGLLTSGSMTAAANRLEKKAWVNRIQDSFDGRCYNLHLAEPGKELIQNAYDKHAQNLEKIAQILNARERKELVRLLKKLGHHARELSF